MTKDEVLKLSLDAIKDLLTEFRLADLPYGSKAYAKGNNAVHALEESLAQAEEPVTFILPLDEQQMFDDWCPYKGSPDPRQVWAAAMDAANGILLGASPPKLKEWVGLTDDEIKEIHSASIWKNIGFATGLTEAKLREKNA